MTARALMLQGTGLDVGKTLLTAGRIVRGLSWCWRMGAPMGQYPPMEE